MNASSSADATRWLLLAYKIPREPSANRVYAWRKVKQLGAISIQDAVWVLPETPRTREQFQWLAAEITELGGEATLWTSSLIYATDDNVLKRQFESQVAEMYRDVLTGLKQKQRDLTALSKRYQQAQSQDFFRHELGGLVRDKLLAAHSDKPTVRKGRKP